MVVGVNGVGKTTTIGKLAYQYKKREGIVFIWELPIRFVPLRSSS